MKLLPDYLTVMPEITAIISRPTFNLESIYKASLSSPFCVPISISRYDLNSSKRKKPTFSLV